MKSDAQAKRDELVKMVSQHGSNLSNTASEYYSWSDARLKGFLRSHGLTADKIPSDRNQLLRTTRAYYGGSSGSHFGGGILDSLKDGVRSVLGGVQDASGKIEQNAKVASISASSAASVASAKASSASAKAHNEL